MVFSNLFFLYLFLPANIILYFTARKNRTRNLIMVSFSLVFYAWGEPVWVFLLIATAFFNWLLALRMERYREAQEGQRARYALAAAVILDLSLLVLFKYTDFLYENVNALFGTSFTGPGLVLPIGISFYTFQIISYMADVYRKDVEAQPDFLKFLMYVTMYHQLVAGPIVRYQWIAQEIDHREVDPGEVWQGLCRFCVGLCKKVVVANAAGKLAGQYLDGELSRLTTAGALFGILMFTLQIYYDFSAYSDMAIGMGRIFGFHYMENFNYPYIARSVTDFWRRWHISLSSFFRDYVYIPLGGKYQNQLRNISIVWLLTGLWHGASWNFVLWGAWYGALLILEKKVLLARLEKLPAAAGWAWSFLTVLVGWSIFYFTDFSRLAVFLPILLGGRLTSDPGLWVTVQNNLFWMVLAAVFCAPVLPWIKARVDAYAVEEKQQAAVVALQAAGCLLLVMVSTAYLVGQSYNPFLYFRF
ncbi:MAG: MBOAT family protein [Angelakisella sp.]|jgi:alginate O-acetyltransferase complex protein AlgI|nr:MBOAT family protein [Angelakisella sp.]